MGTTHAVKNSHTSATVRPAAFAGAFYPGDANALAAEVASLLADVRHAHDAQTKHTYEINPAINQHRLATTRRKPSRHDYPKPSSPHTRATSIPAPSRPAYIPNWNRCADKSAVWC